ncbi:MAG: hypothetical protein SFX73_34675, partial [Kofleriaceae bacterium]|nr:hypothetical protein [Kofleriaceae bacterium]
TQRPRFSLGLNALGSDAEGLRALVRQPALAGIEQLAFAGIYLDEGAARAFAASPFTRELTGLTISDKDLSMACVRALLAAPFARSLRHLALDRYVGDIGDLLDVLDGGPLESLELPHDELGPRTAAVLGRIRLPQLTRLSLSYNEMLGDDGCAHVVGNPSFGNVRVLEFLGTGAGLRTAHALIGNNALTALDKVRLGGEVPDAAAQVLEGAAKLRRVQRLQLVGASDQAIEALARSLDLTYGVTNKLLAA